MNTEEKVKSLIRRSVRTPKPKKKEEEKTIKHLGEGIGQTNKKKVKTEAKTEANSSTEVSVETSKMDVVPDKAIANDKIVVPSTSQPSTSSGTALYKKQDLRQKPKKLGLLVIDCEDIVGDKKINVDAFKTYLQQNIKNEGKTNDPRINIERQNMQVLINAEIYVEQNYIKYLIKKYLKSTNLHNWIKIVNGKKLFTLKYVTK